MRLERSHRRWLIVNALIASTVINFAINLGVGWLETRGHPRLPTWSVAVTHSSVVGDAVGTLFTLPLITCLLVTAAVHREQRLGAMTPLGWRPAARWWPVLVPQGALRRGFRLGVATFVVLVVPVPDGLNASQFVVFHLIVTVGLGALVTPFVAFAAMTDGRAATD
jgi:hypothetical protein